MRLCPNCARQGQTFPNVSKRNQKYDEKSEWNQLHVITRFLNFQKFGLKIPVLRFRSIRPPESVVISRGD